jgi:ketosteroid isomerase-like protein
MATMAQTSAKNRGGFSSNGTAEAEVRALMAERRNASIAGDTETIINSTADAYLQTDIKGYRQDKATWLNQYFKPLADLIKAGKFRWEVYDHKDLQFRIFGDCAIVTGSLELKGSGARFGPQHAWVADPTANLGATLHFTHVYIKQDGKWLLAGLHNQMPLSNPQE